MKTNIAKRLGALLLCVCMMGALLCGCGAAKTDDAAGDGDLREINVVLDWYPNALHSFLYIAMDKGYFADEGLKVNIQFPTNTNDAMSLVAAGKAEVGLYYLHDLIQARTNQDVKIKSIGALLQSPLNAIVSLSEKNINSPADLVGKTIGYSGTPLSEAMVKAIMEHEGADAASVTMQDVGFDLMSSMTTGNVDATIGCMINHEVPQMEHEGFDVSYFDLTDYGMPNYYEEIFLAGDDTIANDSDMLAGFLRACQKGFADFKADPEAGLKVLLAHQDADNFPLTPEVEQASCQVLLPVMESADAPFLSQTEAVWQQNIDWMFDQGLISEKPAYSDLVADIDF
jgi:putative hydroxymethylpyrimidine transport system substrate-binding protein